MQIGTAAPTTEELSAAKHHFIHHKYINDEYNVGTFEKDAIDKLEEIFTKNDTAILVGGSGLYIDAVTKGLDDFPNIDKSVRQSLNAIYEEQGLQTLKDQLKIADPVSYDSIAINNPHRVIRALEVSLGTDRPYSFYLNKKKSIRPFKTISIGLSGDRPAIYDRINKRVDIMIKQGLLDEVKSLLPYQEFNALNTVGYKELFKYLHGEWNYDFAVSEIKKNTRRFAKRQLTWFRKDENVIWFDYQASLEEIISTIELRIV